MNRYILSFAFVFCTLFADPGQCQWVQTNMPGGGSITGLAIIGTNFFAGTRVGLFRSTDKSANWAAVSSEMPLLDGWVNPFALASNLFVSTTGPLLRSTDNGISWTSAGSGLPEDCLTSLVSIDSNIFTTSRNGVYVSTNNGSSWTVVNTGFPARNPVYLVAAIGTNLFACTAPVPYDTTYDYGLFRSTNNGASWTAAKGGLPDSAITDLYFGIDYPMVQCITSIGTSIFAGTRYKGIYRSTDNGSTWIAVNSGLTNYSDRLQFSSFAVIDTNIFAAANADIGWNVSDKFCRVFRSTNNGAQWTEVNAGMGANMHIGFLMASGTDLFAGGSRGIYKSFDYGTSWTASVSGLTGYRTNALLSSNGNLIAGTDIGIFLSADGGSSWTTINSGLTATAINPISSLAMIGPNIIAGTEGLDTSAGIYYSTDNGKSWNTGYSDKTPGNQTWVYSMAVNGTTIFAGTNFYILRSIDSGVTWTSVIDTGVFCLAVMGTNIFGGSNQLGVIRSVDNGTTWTHASSGLPETIQAPLWASFIISLAVQGTNLYAATGNCGAPVGDFGVFLSRDSGTSWIAVNSGLPAHAYIPCLSVSGTQVFAATDTSGVFVSSDTGRSWAAVNSGLPDDISLRSMLTTGTEAPNGLPKSQAHSSAISGRQLFAGTYNRGIWRLPLSNTHILDNAKKPKVDRQPKIRIASMRSRCTISYSIASSCFVTLSLYSILGKLLSTIINKAQSPGNYTAAISHNFAAGFYVLKFKAGNYEATNKLLLQ